MPLFGRTAPPVAKRAGHPLRVVPVGAVTPPVLERAVAIAHEVLGYTPHVVEHPLDVGAFLDAGRRQYRADLILAALRGSAEPGEKVLGVTALDLFLPVLTYVYGFAELNGVAAVVSVHRLDPKFDGREDDAGLLLERFEKEVMHELGHVRGLVHCADRRCVMASAHDVGEIDIEEPSYCPGCIERIR